MPRTGQIVALDWHAEGSTFITGKPREWTRPPAGSMPSVDIAADGKRALAAITPETTEAEVRLAFLLHFGDEIRRRLASAGGR